MSAPFLESPRLRLRALEPEDATPEYLSWLNDAEVLRYRAPKAFPSSLEDVRQYIADVRGRGELVLALCLKEGHRHIGNLSLGHILWVHGSAELSLMIGARDCWGRGLGKEAIAAVSEHVFRNMGLQRLWAESPNPAFCAAVKSLGWVHEGTKRNAFLVDGEHVDVHCFGLLRTDAAARASAKA
jgi:[ribosomal protein S5]-alanine N-acetyltransferase